jgi:hypothetical protein
VKLRVIDIVRAIDLAAIAFFALSACSQEDAAPRTGPVPSADVAFPSSNPSTSTDGAAPPPAEAIIRLTGTVHRLDLEGGVYVIRTEDGTQYRPIELPEEFRVDGLPVEAEARRRDDVMTVDMSGTTVELLDIRKRTAD